MIYVNFNHLCDFIKALLYEETRKSEGKEGGKRRGWGELGLSETEPRAGKKASKGCMLGVCHIAHPRKQRPAPATAFLGDCVSSALISYRNAPCSKPSRLREANKIEGERGRGRAGVRERLALCKMY